MIRSLWRDPRYATLRFIIVAFVVWRGALFLLDLAAVYSFPERAPNPNKDYVAFADSPFWSSFARWDSGWYARIVARGYYFEDRQSDVAFFPAYPYLTRWLGAVIGNTWAAGLAISNGAFLGGLFYLYGIARRYLDEEGSRRAVLFALCFPTSCFFSSFYSESLFFFTVAAAFYHYERDALLPAALFGAAAALTRSTGALLFPAFVLGALHRRGWRPTWRLAWLLAIPVGLAAFMLILSQQVGDPLAFLKAQSGWGRDAAMPFVALFREARSFDWRFTNVACGQVGAIVDLIVAVGLFAVVAASLRRLDLAHSLFALGAVVMPLASGIVLSMERFAACVLPVYLLLAMAARRRSVEQFLIYALALALALHTIAFATWHWAG